MDGQNAALCAAAEEQGGRKSSYNAFSTTSFVQRDIQSEYSVL
jgi:hypothetical protein